MMIVNFVRPMVPTTELLPCERDATNSGYSLSGGWRQKLRDFYEECLNFHRVSIHSDNTHRYPLFAQANQLNLLRNLVSSLTEYSKIIGDESIIKAYSRVRIFLDENFEDIEKFTALGSIYLIHDSVVNVKLYNFRTAQYEPLEGKFTFLLQYSSTIRVEQVLT